MLTSFHTDQEGYAVTTYRKHHRFNLLCYMFLFLSRNLFLCGDRVRQCQVVLLSGNNKGCFLPAPYVDDYGETDVTLK